MNTYKGEIMPAVIAILRFVIITVMYTLFAQAVVKLLIAGKRNASQKMIRFRKTREPLTLVQ